MRATTAIEDKSNTYNGVPMAVTSVSSLPNFLPGPIPKFTNFNRFAVKNAFSNKTTADDASKIDTTFFKDLKANPPNPGDIPDDQLISLDVDGGNSLIVHKIKCVYPTDPSAPKKAILAYKINIDNTNTDFISIADNTCVPQPTKAYSDDYMPNCASKCRPKTPPPGVDMSAPGTAGIYYKCDTGNNIERASKSMYIPRGGWMHAAKKKEDLINTISTTKIATNVIDSSQPILNKSINVTTKDGSPIYIINNNSTTDINTWTKLQDLCVKI